MALGIVPENLLPLKSNTLSLVYVSKEFGIVPTILLSATDRVFMKGMFAMVEGNVPVSLLPSTRKYSNFVNEP